MGGRAKLTITLLNVEKYNFGHIELFLSIFIKKRERGEEEHEEERGKEMGREGERDLLKFFLDMQSSHRVQVDLDSTSVKCLIWYDLSGVF